ncbi:MAG: DUF3641 domain-containing protein, partial [Planctomycetes bacterium]|nr:DUF3641 domain-containing protein [Planctomycetota bacterium]
DGRAYDCDFNLALGRPSRCGGRADRFDPGAFLAERRVAVVGSLPVPLEEGFRLQRGAGALEPAIEGLRRLEAAGLGREGGPGLVLVHNPAGPSLPPLAAEVEAEARRALAGRGLSVPRIEAMVNAPVGRFGDALRAAGTLEAYLELLRAAFRPESLGTLDCLRQLSLGWDGRAYGRAGLRLRLQPGPGTPLALRGPRRPLRPGRLPRPRDRFRRPLPRLRGPGGGHLTGSGGRGRRPGGARARRAMNRCPAG